MRLRIWLAVAVTAGIMLASCSTTVAPEAVKATEIMYDGNEANAGFIGFERDGGGVLSDGGRARYNALIEMYGHKMLIPLKPHDGISPGPDPGTWRIDAQHLVYFLEMQQMYRDDR